MICLSEMERAATLSSIATHSTAAGKVWMVPSDQEQPSALDVKKGSGVKKEDACEERWRGGCVKPNLWAPETNERKNVSTFGGRQNGESGNRVGAAPETVGKGTLHEDEGATTVVSDGGQDGAASISCDDGGGGNEKGREFCTVNTNRRGWSVGFDASYAMGMDAVPHENAVQGARAVVAEASARRQPLVPPVVDTRIDKESQNEAAMANDCRADALDSAQLSRLEVEVDSEGKTALHTKGGDPWNRASISMGASYGVQDNGRFGEKFEEVHGRGQDFEGTMREAALMYGARGRHAHSGVKEETGFGRGWDPLQGQGIGLPSYFGGGLLRPFPMHIPDPDSMVLENPDKRVKEDRFEEARVSHRVSTSTSENAGGVWEVAGKNLPNGKLHSSFKKEPFLSSSLSQVKKEPAEVICERSQFAGNASIVAEAADSDPKMPSCSSAALAGLKRLGSAAFLPYATSSVEKRRRKPNPRYLDGDDDEKPSSLLPEKRALTCSRKSSDRGAPKPHWLHDDEPLMSVGNGSLTRAPSSPTLYDGIGSGLIPKKRRNGRGVAAMRTFLSGKPGLQCPSPHHHQPPTLLSSPIVECRPSEKEWQLPEDEEVDEDCGRAGEASSSGQEARSCNTFLMDLAAAAMDSDSGADQEAEMGEEGFLVVDASQKGRDMLVPAEKRGSSEEFPPWQFLVSAEEERGMMTQQPIHITELVGEGAGFATITKKGKLQVRRKNPDGNPDANCKKGGGKGRGSGDGVLNGTRGYVAWTVQEVLLLLDGVAKFGIGKWAEIKKNIFAESMYRTQIDLKDKWRNLLKASRLQPHAGGKKYMNKDIKKQMASFIPPEVLERVRELEVQGVKQG